MEGGLAKLDFLSDANSRMKKFNQLMKRVMEKLHSFVIPGKLKMAVTFMSCGFFPNRIYNKQKNNKTVIKLNNLYKS